MGQCGGQAKLRRGKTVYYSYEACGSNDTFTLSYNKILGRSHWRPDALGYWTAFGPEFYIFYGIEGKSAHHHTHTIIQILYIHVHGNDIKTDMTSVLAAFAQNLTKECLPLPQVFSLHKKARVRLALDSE